MSDTDTKSPTEKTLHVSPKTLTLKRPTEQNTVRQSFSHGRSKAVVVETVKRRGVGPGAAKEALASAAPKPAAAPAAPAARKPLGTAVAPPAETPPAPAPAARPS